MQTVKKAAPNTYARMRPAVVRGCLSGFLAARNTPRSGTKTGAKAICIGMPLPLRSNFPSYGMRVSQGTFMKTKKAIPRQIKIVRMHIKLRLAASFLLNLSWSAVKPSLPELSTSSEPATLFKTPHSPVPSLVARRRRCRHLEQVFINYPRNPPTTSTS